MIPDLPAITSPVGDIARDKMPFTAVYVDVIADLLLSLGETRGAVSVTSIRV